MLVTLLLFVGLSVRSVLRDITIYRLEIVDIIVGTIACLVYRFASGAMSDLDMIVGVGIAYLSFIVIYRLSRGRLGPGDVWYSGFIGCAFGFRIWDLALVLAVGIGICYVAVMKLRDRSRPVSAIRIPFCPCMFVGALASAALGGVPL